MGLDGGIGDHHIRDEHPDRAADPSTLPPGTPEPEPEPEFTESPEPSETPAEPATGPEDDPVDQPTDETPGTEPPRPTDSPSPPTRPANLGVSERTGSSVVVTWHASTADLGVEGYAVHVDGSRTDTVPGTSTTISGLRSGASYVISIAAIDGGGNVGAPASVTATTLDTEPPTTPSDLVVSAKEGEALTLTWSPSSDNVGVTSYAVYVDGKRSRTASGTTATVGDLTPATTYRISVAAMDAAGNVSGKASTEATTEDTIAPTKPGDLHGRSSITAVTLEWTRSTDNVGVSGYAVYMDGRRAATTGSTTTTINNLDGATTYTFSVAAFDAAGNYSEHASIEVHTMARRGEEP
nr:fibronectin type III domain-containing protein [Phytoactinopolyspora mesophila]